MRKLASLLILILLSGFNYQTFAQGISCAAAESITVDGACDADASISDATIEAPVSPSSCGAMLREGWYKFTAIGVSVEVTVKSDNQQLLVQVLSGTCGSLTPIGCANNNTTSGAQTETVSLSSLTVGNIYYIRIANQNNSVLYLSSVCVSSSTCKNAEPFCTGISYTFPMETNCAGETGPNYGCLYIYPNPVWYYLKIGTSGNIDISISSPTGNDVDFVCWGPFATATGPCTAQLTGSCLHRTGPSCEYPGTQNPAGCCPDNTNLGTFSYPSGNIVDCSYDPAASETCHIPGSAVAGQYYLLLITNFSNATGDLSFTQTGGTGATDCSILPIELMLFEATCENNSALLTWVTASETNNNFFTIERSTDAIAFTPIGIVNGAGNSNSSLYYQFTDANVEQKITSYYRLKQTDYDGTISYSSIAAVNCSNIEEITIYNNEDNEMIFSFDAIEGENYIFKIFDCYGRLVAVSSGIAMKGLNEVEISSASLSTGVYLVNYYSDDNMICKKVFVK